MDGVSDVGGMAGRFPALIHQFFQCSAQPRITRASGHFMSRQRTGGG